MGIIDEINITENLRFNTDFGEIVYDIYEPREIPKKPIIIQIAHGMIEHRARYKWLASNFARVGYIVAINDHRGHGDSVVWSFYGVIASKTIFVFVCGIY